jgi:Xaa-Pro dipeptidase
MKLISLQNKLEKATLISDAKMIHYLIGHHFHVGERFLALLIQKDQATLFLNDLFPYTHPKLDIVRFNDAQDPIQLLAHHLKEEDVLYVDKSLQAGFLLKLLKYTPLLELKIDVVADHVRSIKDDEEIAKMIEASRINDVVMHEVPTLLKEGVTEVEVATAIEQLFYKHGADGLSFEPIVAFGDHCADPHAVPSERRLKEADSIIIDMGCIKDGYCSDMTRSYFLGNHKHQNLYDLVLQANLEAIKAVKPGVSFKDVDQAARSVIEKAGYGAYFIHRTGHGIGQDVHEPYDVSSSNDRLIEEGMCFSIEPGIYLEGQVGLRIEDLVCVTKDGCIVLNKAPK